MRLPGKALDGTTRIRQAAVRLCQSGELQEDVAAAFGVGCRTLSRWLHWSRAGSGRNLADLPRAGRPPKLDAAQEAEVLDWLDDSALSFGFATDQWTSPRVAGLIEARFGVAMNHRYLNDWLRRRNVTPQMPEPKAVERDEQAIEAWVRYRWPRVKKRRKNFTPALFSRTNRASSLPRWRDAACRVGA